VDVYTFLRKGATISLVDTPSFDNDQRSDFEVLRLLASWLTLSYKSDIMLDGIIYFHDIRIPRTHSLRRDLEIFKRLCGDRAMKNVLLATVGWDEVRSEAFSGREHSLVTEDGLWGAMVNRGSRVVRHYNNQSSALRLVDMFLDIRTDPTPLEIQVEFVIEGKLLQDTAAGRSVKGGPLDETNREAFPDRKGERVKRFTGDDGFRSKGTN